MRVATVSNQGDAADDRNSYRFASSDNTLGRLVIDVCGISIGGPTLAVIGGPCGVESKEQVFAVARYITESGVGLFRAGAFKPRTNPYSFQGLGQEGIELLALVKREFNLGIVTEATDLESFPGVEKVADVVQIGARNMQNFALLRRAGISEKPILLKRGQGATLEEWLLAAEYILSEGNARVILCERGIRTWSNHARNTFDVSVIPAVKALSHLPVIADPSHAVGRKDLVIPCALAGVAAGADGILVETHCQPSSALSDGQQALLPNEFSMLVNQAFKIKNSLQLVDTNNGLCF
ncbi:MAG: 3-deoxy-7-phosphoheptulonate synthase [Holophagales bacterium]|jgi:3-deoxy-7-phosphoheptulonate synthase|nr:3-deoxy-7-phosphoheptulonate synthase [Holophagales bacterium]